MIPAFHILHPASSFSFYLPKHLSRPPSLLHSSTTPTLSSFPPSSSHLPRPPSFSIASIFSFLTCFPPHLSPPVTFPLLYHYPPPLFFTPSSYSYSTHSFLLLLIFVLFSYSPHFLFISSSCLSFFYSSPSIPLYSCLIFLFILLLFFRLTLFFLFLSVLFLLLFFYSYSSYFLFISSFFFLTSSSAPNLSYPPFPLPLSHPPLPTRLHFTPPLILFLVPLLFIFIIVLLLIPSTSSSFFLRSKHTK